MSRSLDWLCALGLASLAALKLLSPDPGSYAFLTVSVAVVECLLAAAFACGRWPRGSAIGLVGLGLAFSVWTVWRGPAIIAGSPCGCLGTIRPSIVVHLLIATSLLSLGGIQALRAGRSGGWPPALGPRSGQPQPGAAEGICLIVASGVLALAGCSRGRSSDAAGTAPREDLGRAAATEKPDRPPTDAAGSQSPTADSAAQKPAPGPSALKGQILGATSQFGFVLLGIGERAGVRPGDHFKVLRAGSEAGSVKVDKVFPDTASATVVGTAPPDLETWRGLEVVRFDPGALGGGSEKPSGR